MSFDDELTAFREYARIFPNNCILLVDTYDVEQGIRNAITVGLEMRGRGDGLAGIHVDSGDLSWLSKMARRMLDEAGRLLSNDLVEYTIQSMLEEGRRHVLRRGHEAGERLRPADLAASGWPRFARARTPLGRRG